MSFSKFVSKVPVVVDERYNAFSIYRMHERKTEELENRRKTLPQRKAALNELKAKLTQLTADFKTAYDDLCSHPAAEEPSDPPPVDEVDETQLDDDGNPVKKRKRRRRRKKKQQTNESIQLAETKSTKMRELDSERLKLEALVKERTAEIERIESNSERTQYDIDSMRHMNLYFTERARLNEFDRMIAKGELSAYVPEQITAERNMYLSKLHNITVEYARVFFPDEAQALVPDSGEIATAPKDTSTPGCRTSDLEMGWGYDQIRSYVSPVRVYTYKRLNHFREYLRQRQGKSHVYVPPQVWTDIKAELAKFYCTPDNYQTTLTFDRMKHALKRLRLSKYFDNTRHLTKTLNPSIQIIDIPISRECILCQRFTELEVPFEKYKKEIVCTRKNFMSYPVVSYKLCELEGWTEYLPHFKLLKSRKLLALQDKWWELCCKMLGWPFIRTVGRISMDDDD